MKKKENIPISEEEENSHKNHLAEKIAMRGEKSKDKSITDKKRSWLFLTLRMLSMYQKLKLEHFFTKGS